MRNRQQHRSRIHVARLLLLCLCFTFGFPHLVEDNFTIRYKRQDVEDESKSLICDYGQGETLQLCMWTIPEDNHPYIKWAAGQGSQAYFLGGPLVDHSLADPTGGYVYFETSYQATNRVFSSASLESGLRDELRLPSSSLGTFENGTALTTGEARMDLGLKKLNLMQIFKQPLVSNTWQDQAVPNSGLLISPNVSKTGAQGFCITFYYNIDGLSAEKLRILIRDMETEVNQTLWESRLQTGGRWIKGQISYAYNLQHQVILEGVAKNADEPERAYRGYIAVDDMQIQPKGDKENTGCHGHCTFEGGFCGWSNEEEKDDFDWSLARGSNSFFTGPVRDYYSFSKEYPLGGYIYIDAGYPRRPGDKAILKSPIFEATGDEGPRCFIFAVHMYGNGVGTLRVKYRSAEDEDKEKTVWEMSGDAGNNWYLAQLPIASATPFHIIFEGIIGQNYLGSIAIDSIAIEHGSCPISPQTASLKSGDCTFEESMCHWTNPLSQAGLDDFDWIRQFSFGNYGPKRDHTKNSPNGYFLSLNGDQLQPVRGGTRAWIISPEFTTTGNTPKCMSFYYTMHQRLVEPSGPSLGGLRVYIRTTDSKGEVVLHLVWRLNNHQSMSWKHAQVALGHKKGEDLVPPPYPYQVVIEGIWGDARVGSIAIDDISFFDGSCPTIPKNGAAVQNECFFERGLCGWVNETRRSANREGQLSASLGSESGLTKKVSLLSVASSKRGESLTWRLATQTSRPANLQDHTFRAPIGYIFFDVFNENTLQQPVLRSPRFAALEGEESKRCLSFWFSGFGRGDSTSLKVYQVVEEDGAKEVTETTEKSKTDENGKRTLLWKIQTRQIDSKRPVWHYGQVPLTAESPYQLIFEGEANDGGFALDDITTYNATCTARPPEAAVVLKMENN